MQRFYTQRGCLCSCLTEADAPDTVSNSVQWRRPTHHSHDVGNHQQYRTRHTGFGRQAHLRDESKRLYEYAFHSQQKIKIALEGRCGGRVNFSRYSRETPSDQKSRTCRTSAWDSECFAQPRRSGVACPWSDRFRRWPAWRPWCSPIHRWPRWSRAKNRNGIRLLWLKLFKKNKKNYNLFIGYSWLLPGSRSLGHQSYLLPVENTVD